MKAYICDACGRVMHEPHEVKMRLFYIETIRDTDGMLFDKRFAKRRKIELCPECFHGLYLIAKKEKNEYEQS